MSEFRRLLQRIETGDTHAAEQLLSLAYDELRRIAARKVAAECSGQTLQPTELVHEAWLRLGADNQPNWESRAHFFGAAAEAMRRILIDHARRRHALRHGGDQQRVALDDVDLAGEGSGEDEHLLAVHEALDRFAIQHPRAAELVKLRYFVGLTIKEAADALDVATPTAKRDWAYARAWLSHEIVKSRADRLSSAAANI